ncbi:hypothetical protein DPMN_152295 [Dreissena polymorpha]|uniref:Uncharacterized protein n=1 Tax=Dreissena polymorpha TaxID=45954 RepID=A0A9D4J7S6_DREPO|nr:hypothetical protein DPMN_152295 [Dreissena polymorpha]
MKRCFTGGAQSVSRMQGCLLQRRRFAEPLQQSPHQATIDWKRENIQTFPTPTMWIKMFGLMILGRMCGQGGLHYIMMQLCIQQHVNLSQRMLMLLNLLNDVEKNPGPDSKMHISSLMWFKRNAVDGETVPKS